MAEPDLDKADLLTQGSHSGQLAMMLRQIHLNPAWGLNGFWVPSARFAQIAPGRRAVPGSPGQCRD